MTPQEVRVGLRHFAASSSRKFMVGVLASSKTLAGRMNKWPWRYPEVERIHEIFQAHPAALDMIHYSTDEPNTLSHQLLRLVDIGGAHLHGFQLNIAWPSIGEIEIFQEATDFQYRIVLQIGERAMREVDGSLERFAEMVYWYGGVVDDVLIDSSGGKGRPLDAEKARGFLRESSGHRFNVGVAGGLGPDSFHLIAPLLGEFPDLNVDAEGNLRDSETDDLDVVKMSAYLVQALKLLDHESRV